MKYEMGGRDVVELQASLRIDTRLLSRGKAVLRGKSESQRTQSKGENAEGASADKADMARRSL